MDKQYKDTFVSRNSTLHTALAEGRLAEAKKIYDETTAAFCNLYGSGVSWFISKHREGK